MSEHGEEEQGRFAVPGPEPHESEESLGRDELGTEDQPVPPPSSPKEPAPVSLPKEGGLWARIMGKLTRRA